MSKKQSRMPVTIAGIVIGTASGWDESDFLANIYYDFQAAPTVDIPSGDLYLSYDTGTFQIYVPADATLLKEGKIMSVLLKMGLDG